MEKPRLNKTDRVIFKFVDYGGYMVFFLVGFSYMKIGIVLALSMFFIGLILLLLKYWIINKYQVK